MEFRQRIPDLYKNRGLTFIKDRSTEIHMVIKVYETWPSQATQEVNKKYSELLKQHLPRFSKSIGLKMVPSGGNIKSSVVYEIGHGQENMGLKELTQMLSDLSRISGYQYEIEIGTSD